MRDEQGLNIFAKQIVVERDQREVHTERNVASAFAPFDGIAERRGKHHLRQGGKLGGRIDE